MAAVTGPERDLLVLGGGVTGLGLARLAARSGWSVTVVERDDLATGASSSTSHMLHGGLRYLEQGRFRLVREALAERMAVSRLAPALARPVRFLVPLRKGDRVGPFRLRAGLALYDLLAGRSGMSPHVLAGAKQALAMEPALEPDGLRAAGIYSDVVMDDARIAIAGRDPQVERPSPGVTGRLAASPLLVDRGDRGQGHGQLGTEEGDRGPIADDPLPDAQGPLVGPEGILRATLVAEALALTHQVPGFLDRGLRRRDLDGRPGLGDPGRRWLVGTPGEADRGQLGPQPVEVPEGEPLLDSRYRQAPPSGLKARR